MGSKRAMLTNGLGDLLDREVINAGRFVDLFSGSGAVATHVAKNYRVPVYAYDLQSYSAAVSGACVKRTRKLSSGQIWNAWFRRSKSLFDSIDLIRFKTISPHGVKLQRAWCSRQLDLPITVAYGGHYFSAEQAVWFDAFRQRLPRSTETREAALAALIVTASQCVAAPGHTAQPFQPTPSALPFLREAWTRDVVARLRNNLVSICASHALLAGNAKKLDANIAAKKLVEGDLAFIDPPYSGVHYSRFYHVLESISVGKSGIVSGIGRYPEAQYRPRSRYSLRGCSSEALDDLLDLISSKGARAILTFPNHDCSNGLSGDEVIEIADAYFTIEEQRVKTKFSTLGGHNHNKKTDKGRQARKLAEELILVLSPR